MKMCDVEFCDFAMWKNDELIINRVEQGDYFLEQAIDNLPCSSSTTFSQR